jgi:hypothetical protein
VASGTVSSGGYNVSDKGNGTGSTESGWNFDPTDAQATSLPLRLSDLRPLSGGDAYRRVAEKPAGYPDADFYGTPIPASNAMAGAVQNAIVSNGYIVDYGTQGPGEVRVRGTADQYGLYSGSVTFTAAPASNSTFLHWTVDGQEQPAQTPANALTLALTGHVTVRAVFIATWTVSSGADDGPGSLRQAITGASSGDYIVFKPGLTVTLATPLPPIYKSLVIEGNGSTLTQSGFTENDNSQLFQMSTLSAPVVVRISRLHFKGGRATRFSGAIYNSGNLTMESCIFSDNRVTRSITYDGGAIFTSGDSSVLTVSGCTFVGNAAGGSGGAIARGSGGTLTLTGNVFWGNTAAYYPVVSPGTTVSGGYNISDRPLGTGQSQSGWNPAETDEYAAGLLLHATTFRPFSTGAAYRKIPITPADYPAADFYGNPIPAVNAAAGAVQDAIITSGYALDYGTEGSGTVEVTSGTPDSYGMYSGSVTLEAAPAAGASFIQWIVNGVGQPAQTPANRLTLAMDGHKTVRAVFGSVRQVTSGADSGAGSLRQALNDAAAGDYIVFDQGLTVTLTAVLPQITKSLVIEGNGSTLTQSGIAESATSQLLYINSTTANIRISRLHFKGGRATNNGAAIYNYGDKLSLESCVFSDNRTSTALAYGGALYTMTTGDVIISACTFTGNTAGTTGGRGGAIFSGRGALNLWGNLFWGNTAATHSVTFGATVTSLGYNVSDKDSGTGTGQSGWTFAATDEHTASQPLHTATFKPFSTGAAYQKITTTPAGYPAVDFYGTAIPASKAAAGAAQDAIISSGYALDYGSEGSGTVEVISGTPDDYDMYSGSVTLEAAPDPGASIIQWTVNGVGQPAQTPADRLTLAMDGHKTVRAIFATVRQVTSGANSGAGSLRQALTDAAAGDYIVFGQGLTVTLTATLPQITKNLVIEGNGSTLTRDAGFTTSNTTSQLLYISSTTANVRINRLHFKGGRATNSGAAIYNTGILTLESCVFSDNRTSAASAYGGALYATGAVTVSGCTFTGNAAGTTGGAGGAIYATSGALTLTGNLFWENTAATYSVVRKTSGSVVSNGYNVSDKTTGTGESGWTFVTGDVRADGLPFHAATFKPFSTGAAYQKITTTPAGYPAVDFYGTAIPAFNAMAGAVQDAIITSGYALDYGHEGSGTVEAISGTPDSYGMYSGSVTLEATPDPGASLIQWTVNGVGQPVQTPANRLTLAMDGHKTVRAVFATVRQVTSGADSGAGSLRQALTDAAAGDYIVFQSGLTVTLTAMLTINKSLTIEGNGSTLTQNGLTTGAINQLLSITGSATTVRISRIHFTGGRSRDYGSAIRNAGILTLESCIFSDNATDYGSSYAYGGAIATTAGSLTVLGCTFNGNSVQPGNSQGGAIYRGGGTLSLTGNIFVGNIASYPVVYHASPGAATGGYNVSDVAPGTAAGQSGWTFAISDVTLTDVVFDANKKPSSATGLPVIPSLPAGFPTVYFDGTGRGSNSAPGAMPSN